MTLLSALVLLVATSPLANCAEDKATNTSAKEEQASTAIQFLGLIANGQLKLDLHTAVSKHCNAKRRNELEARIARVRNHEFKDTDVLCVEAQLTDSNFAAVLIRADNTINPLDTRIIPVAMLWRDNRWIPAPLLASFSNTGYGYSEAAERSVKKLETWMAQQKNIYRSRHIQKAKSEIKSKIIKIVQKSGLAEMTPEQIASYFLKQCRDKNTLAILASMGAASNSEIRSLNDAIELTTKALQLEPTTTSDWHYLTKACVATVIETDEKTGNVIVGCFDPKASEVNDRHAFRIITLETHRQNGQIRIRLPKELSDLTKTKRRKFQRVDQASKEKTAASILKETSRNANESPEQLLDQIKTSINELGFHHFLSLCIRHNEHSTEIVNLQQIARLWNKLSQHGIQTPFTGDVATNNQLALATIEFRPYKGAHYFEKEEIWMFKNDNSWHILPDSMLQSRISQIVGQTEIKAGQESKTEKLIAHLRQQTHEKWLNATFSQTVITTLPTSQQTPSADEAQKTLDLYYAALLAGDMKACFTQSFILANTDKNNLIKQTERRIRGAHDQLPNMQILGISQTDGWVGISTKNTSKVSKLCDYPLYLFSNTQKGIRLFANADFRYPRNSGRKFLNEQNWQQLKNTVPLKSITTLKAIFDEHIQRCEQDINKN